MNEVIKLEKVIKMTEGGRRAVNGVSLNINNKERVIIHGAPGSGKSMLMRLIAGMERPSDGKVLVLDRSVHEMDADTATEFRKKTFGILQRKPAFMGSLTVLENVALPLVLFNISAVKRQIAAKEQLKALGLQYAAKARPSQLSILESYLASIARAFVAQPPIIMIDDMTAELSEKDIEQIKGILQALWQFGEYTILEFSGTESSLLRADRTVTLAHGRIQEDFI